MYARPGQADQAADPIRCPPRKSAMLAHARDSFPLSRPAPRTVWRLPMIPEAPELNALLLRVAENRDRAAFALLFSHFAPRIKAYLLRLGASSALAEDLAQEALLN